MAIGSSYFWRYLMLLSYKTGITTFQNPMLIRNISRTEAYQTFEENSTNILQPH